MRRFIFILIGLAIVILVAALGFWLFGNFSNSTNNQNNPSNLPTFPTVDLGDGSLQGTIDNNTNKPGSLEKLGLLSDSPLFGFWLNKKNNTIYGVIKNGGIAKIENQKTVVVLEDVYSGVNEIKPSFNGINALIENKKEGEESEFFVFLGESSNSFKMPINTIAADWSSKDDNILMFLDSEGLKTINFKTKNKITNLMDLTYLDGEITWTGDNKVILRDKYYQGLEDGWLIDLIKKNLTLITLENINDLTKCISTENGSICAKDEKPPTKEAYITKEIITNDSFYRNNSFLFTPKEKTDAINLIYTGSSLYYLNRIDNLAYQYNLAA